MSSADITNDTKKTRKQLDDYTCGLIIGRFQAGQKNCHIAREIDIPSSTVNDCINRFKKNGTGTIEKRLGIGLKLNNREQRAITRSFRSHPSKPYVWHNAQLKLAGIDIDRRTLSIYAERLGFKVK